MIAWLNGAPTSTTTPAAGTNSGVHAGSVIGAISTSPGSSAVGSAGSSTTRARPRDTPGQPGQPGELIAHAGHRHDVGATLGPFRVRQRAACRTGTAVPAMSSHSRCARRSAAMAFASVSVPAASASTSSPKSMQMSRGSSSCAALDRAAPQLEHRHADLVDDADDVRLRPLAARQERGRRRRARRRTAPASPDRRRASPRSRRRGAPARPQPRPGARSVPRRRRCRACGPPAASARSGLVSHVCEWMSHSFGPASRTRRRTRRAIGRSRRRRACPSARRRDRSSPSMPWSKCAASTSLDRTTRDISHSADRRCRRIDPAHPGDAGASSRSG